MRSIDPKNRGMRDKQDENRMSMDPRASAAPWIAAAAMGLLMIFLRERSMRGNPDMWGSALQIY